MVWPVLGIMAGAAFIIMALLPVKPEDRVRPIRNTATALVIGGLLIAISADALFF